MDQALIKAYRFFRAQGVGCVGESARCALSLARAERVAEERGWSYSLEEEIESYRDVYGEDPPPGVEFYCVVARDETGECIGSLGFCSGDRAYFRTVAAELYSEALVTTHAQLPLPHVDMTAPEESA